MYKKTIYLIVLFFTLFITNEVGAQNPQVKKAAQAVFSLNTFRADGTLISTSHGVFVSSNGEAISQWTPFIGAAKAVVIDSKGKKYDVDGLIGANDIYDVCKFHVKGTTDTAPVAKTMSQPNSKLWLAQYSVKGARIVLATVSKLEKFSISGNSQEYPYYIMDVKTPEDVLYCPIINDGGEVVALVQKTMENSLNAVSALYPTEMKIEKIGSSSSTLSQSLIAPMLPSDYADAQIAFIVAGQTRKGDAYKAIVEQFIQQFPQKEDGYQARARLRAGEKDFAGAALDMEKAISVAEDKAEVHYAYSNLILDKELYMSEDKHDAWNMEKALDEAKKAYEIAGAPAYLQQQGRIFFAMQKYDEAYDIYMKLQDTNMAGPETMFAATQCRQNANAPLDEIIMLMDSTIAVCPQPLTFQSAPYVMQRGLIYQQHGQWRKAVLDFNKFEKLMVGNRIPADFYYNRFVCEREGHLYQQALDDITKATELAPNAAVYFCELASLQVQLKRNEDAIASANKALLLDRKSADAYAILGVAQCVLGKKHEGILNLEEAKSLGYEAADKLIEKYK